MGSAFRGRRRGARGCFIPLDSSPSCAGCRWVEYEMFKGGEVVLFNQARGYVKQHVVIHLPTSALALSGERMPRARGLACNAVVSMLGDTSRDTARGQRDAGDETPPSLGLLLARLRQKRAKQPHAHKNTGPPLHGRRPNKGSPPLLFDRLERKEKLVTTLGGS